MDDNVNKKKNSVLEIVVGVVLLMIAAVLIPFVVIISHVVSTSYIADGLVFLLMFLFIAVFCLYMGFKLVFKGGQKVGASVFQASEPVAVNSNSAWRQIGPALIAVLLAYILSFVFPSVFWNMVFSEISIFVDLFGIPIFFVSGIAYYSVLKMSISFLDKVRRIFLVFLGMFALSFIPVVVFKFLL